MGSWGDRVTVHYGSPARNLHELRSAPLHECEGVGVAVSIDIPTGPSETGRGSRHEAGPLKLGSQTPKEDRSEQATRTPNIQRETQRTQPKRWDPNGISYPARDHRQKPVRRERAAEHNRKHKCYRTVIKTQTYQLAKQMGHNRSERQCKIVNAPAGSSWAQFLFIDP